MAMYSFTLCVWRCMSVHPIGTKVIFPSLFWLCREMAKKYFHRLKWGSIPKYPSHNAMKATMCWITFGLRCCNSI
jgi:hypothetical protein